MESKTALPLVALIGRPNVGKSSLFNRLIKQNKSLTHDLPGVTRDRIYGEVKDTKRPFALVDTGGLVLDGEENFEKEIFYQAQEAIENADLLLLVVDGRQGQNPLDSELTAFLRENDKPVLLVVNKVDGTEMIETCLSDFYALGFPLTAVSAAHGVGIEQLLEDITAALPEACEMPPVTSEKQGLTLALLGRPNVGKSSLINAISGQERMIVSPVAGTTRDSVDVQIRNNEEIYTLIDTAGVRKKNAIVESLEKFSILRSLKSSKRAKLVVLVLDAEQGLVGQDKKLITFLDREKIPFFIAVNKIDLVPHRQRPKVKQYFTDQLRFCSHVPILYTSALNKTGLNRFFPVITKLWEQCQIRINTGRLNRLVSEIAKKHQPPVIKRRRAKIYYLTQGETCPPTFIFFVNNAELVPDSYVRFLEGQIRKHFHIEQAPIKIFFRSTHKKDK